MKNIIKRTALICLSVVMMFVACVNTLASHRSDYVSSEYFQNCGARVYVTAETGCIAASAIINGNNLYDVSVWSECCTCEDGVDYADGYPYYSVSTSLDEVYGYDIPVDERRSIDFVPTAEEYFPSEETIVHSYGDANVIFCDYVLDPDLSDYTYDWVYVYSEDPANHNDLECSICGMWN